MSEVYEGWSLEQRAEAAGRSPAEQRKFEAGYAAAGDRMKAWASQPVPAASWEAEPAPLVPQQFRALPSAHTDRGAWLRTTTAGKLRAVFSPDPPDEQAQEARAAREWADRYEYIYGRRPTPVEARFAVARRSDGLVFASAEEARAAFKAAGLRLRTVEEDEPLPQDSAVITQPVRRG